jgi:20S proteasome alpha/beta subunit
LKEDYKPDCTFQEALILALKVLGKSMDATSPNPDMFEVGVMQKDANGNLIQRKIEGDELKKILEDNKIFDDSKK